MLIVCVYRLRKAIRSTVTGGRQNETDLRNRIAFPSRFETPSRVEFDVRQTLRKKPTKENRDFVVAQFI